MILIFPPGWAPFSPFLALPQLKGFLNKEGYDAEIVDENINFFDTIISTEYLQNHIINLKNRWEELNNFKDRTPHDQEEFLRLTKLIWIYEDIENIDIIKNNYRNGNSYSESELDKCFGIATSIVEEYFEGFQISSTGINNIRYSQDYISSLQAFMNDNENNLYNNFFLKNSDILKKLESHSIVGISVTSSTQLYSALTLSKLIKENFGNTKKVFWGGNFITRLALYHKEKIDFFLDYVDFISVGDGEYTLKALIEGNSLENVPNVIFKNNSDNRVSTKVNFFDLKSLVIPNFDGFSLDKYFSSKLVLPVFASRSCYSNCAFCTIAKATSGHYRVYSIDSIIHMIAELKDKYNCNFFTFVDETFNAKRLLEFSKELIERDIHIYWYTETRFDYYLSLEDTKILYEAGCRKMQFGVESYNENVLDLMNKNINFNNIKSTVKNFIDAGIGTHLFFMIGFPGEKRADAQNTFSFMKEMAEYGNENSSVLLVTIGFGTFGLEIGSPVQINPEKYKISIKTDISDKDFIGLGLKYDILDTFLSADDAEELVSGNKNFPLASFFSFNKRLFSEIQNFIRISLPISADQSILNTPNRILKLNNGLLQKNDCKYLLVNLSKQKYLMINDDHTLNMLHNLGAENLFSDTLKSYDHLRLNPFISYEKKEDYILLKNTLNGETFELEEEALKEILKFKDIKISDREKFDDEDNFEFYNYIYENNIIY